MSSFPMQGVLPWFLRRGSSVVSNSMRVVCRSQLFWRECRYGPSSLRPTISAKGSLGTPLKLFLFAKGTRLSPRAAETLRDGPKHAPVLQAWSLRSLCGEEDFQFEWKSFHSRPRFPSVDQISSESRARPVALKMVGPVVRRHRSCSIVNRVVRRQSARLDRVRKLRCPVPSFLNRLLGILLELAAIQREVHMHLVSRRVFAAGDREPAAAEPHGDDQSSE